MRFSKHQNFHFGANCPFKRHIDGSDDHNLNIQHRNVDTTQTNNVMDDMTGGVCVLSLNLVLESEFA